MTEDDRDRPILLICEGRCNPSIEQVDEWIAKVRECAEKFGPDYHHGPKITALLRGQRYTVHVFYCHRNYQCRICGNVRRF